MDWTDAEGIAETARRAEEIGFEDLYSFDHFGQVDPFVPLMVAAGATTRLRVGPLVLNNLFHHPGLLARTAATVQQLSGGRLILGLGTGYAESEHRALGVPLPPPGARVDQLGESLAVLRSLLDAGSASFEGAHHRVAVRRLGVDPGRRVPLLVGGFGRRVVQLGGQYADMFQFTGLSHEADGTIRTSGFRRGDVAERVRWLEEASADRAVERSVLVQVGDVGPVASEATLKQIHQRNLDPQTLDESPFVLVGSVEQVIDKLERQRADLGIAHIVVRDAIAFAPVVEALRST